VGRQPGFFDADERLRALSVASDPLERLSAVDFELFRKHRTPPRSARAWASANSGGAGVVRHYGLAGFAGHVSRSAGMQC
jgi:hypothetical protein